MFYNTLWAEFYFTNTNFAGGWVSAAISETNLMVILEILILQDAWAQWPTTSGYLHSFPLKHHICYKDYECWRHCHVQPSSQIDMQHKIRIYTLQKQEYVSSYINMLSCVTLNNQYILLGI
jgi:hypothetical protein